MLDHGTNFKFISLHTRDYICDAKALAKWRKYGRKSTIYSQMLTKCFISQGQGTFFDFRFNTPPHPMKNFKLLMEYFVIGIAETSLHSGTLPSYILTLLRLCMLLSGLDPSKKRSNGPFSTTTFHGFTLFPTKPQGSNPTCYSPEVFRPGGGEAVTPADRHDSNGRPETIINDSQFQILPSLA